jgi:hypothetical protein
MNQASFEEYNPEVPLSLPSPASFQTPTHHHHHLPGESCESASSSSQKPKNVPEELKMFLMSHSDQWYTNEQLAEHLNQYVL